MCSQEFVIRWLSIKTQIIFQTVSTFLSEKCPISPGWTCRWVLLNLGIVQFSSIHEYSAGKSHSGQWDSQVSVYRISVYSIFQWNSKWEKSVLLNLRLYTLYMTTYSSHLKNKWHWTSISFQKKEVMCSCVHTASLKIQGRWLQTNHSSFWQNWFWFHCPWYKWLTFLTRYQQI